MQPLRREFVQSMEHGATQADRAGALFARARKGDRSAFGSLATLLQDRLYNAVYRMCGNADDAMELTQETFVKALAALDGFRGESQPYTWLYRIAMNLCLSKQRSAATRRNVSLDGQLSSQATTLHDRLSDARRGPAADAELHEQQVLASEALAALPPAERSLLVMRDIDGMDYAEMASVLNVPLGTMKSQLFRARVALRKAMERLDASAGE